MIHTVEVDLGGRKLTFETGKMAKQANGDVYKRQVSTHHARSSKADGSNSKLLNHSLEWQSGLTLLGSQQALLHRLGLEQVCRLPLRFDFAPEPNRDNDGGWFAGLIGHDLDVGVFHAFSVCLLYTSRCV